MTQPVGIDPERIPQHVAIVMDGNGRWARQRKKPRLYGHKIGADSVREIVETSCEIGIQYLTLYAFSSENWRRPQQEVSGLMTILKNYLVSELGRMEKNKIRLNCIGDTSKLPENVRKVLNNSIEKTADNDRLVLNLALSYGSKDELCMAARALAEKCMAGELSPEQINPELVSTHLYTHGQPDPDLLIRTGGESRLSNFLLWQASYAEIYFTPVMWPEFRRAVFLAAIQEFQRRERRFGKTSEQMEAEVS
ncbi:MAG: isoprenyl transferase [Desulfobulbaceae bacterium]|nr:MAG: isoprenyl transferase [Desulfobulbaceae bacterium]